MTVPMRRIRLAEWARSRGIARITAYRMLQRGILPVPTERSPTGRWFVLVPQEPTHPAERTALYTRATRSLDQAIVINDQIARLSEWAAERHRQVHLVVREIATPYVDQLPKLAQLLVDQQITEIVIENPTVIGQSLYHVLVAALVPQGRTITVANTHTGVRPARRRETEAAIISMCRVLYGPEKGLAAARRALGG